jgi:hypothetical protein
MPTCRAGSIVLLCALLVSACSPSIGTGGNGNGGGPGGGDGGSGSGGNGDGGAHGGMHGDGGGGGGDGGSCGTSLDQAGCPCPRMGAMRSCYTGPAATENKGLCKDGMQSCVRQGEFLVWGACTGDVVPAAEVCSDTADHNCNGLTGCDDPACAGMTGCCTSGQMRACYDGPAGTAGVGQCKAGSQSCNPDGSWPQVCTGEVLPGIELGNCQDGIDNDCNGQVDCQDIVCLLDPACQPKTCQQGAMQACYDGPAGTDGVGQCHGGMQVCTAQGQWPATCTGEVTPGSESGNCSDGIDNDCNGKVDCQDAACALDAACLPQACTPNTPRPCYDGPSGTDGVGQCHSGTQTCTAQGQWPSVCSGEVTPGVEAGHCSDNIDNDCDGKTDCQDITCAFDPACQPKVCSPGATQSCYSGPSGTEGIGQCKAGSEMCASDGSGWSSCSGQVLPGNEAANCSNGVDDDCNGLTDCNDPACFSSPACCVAVPPNATIYATSATTLYVVDPSGTSETAVGNYGVADRMTDIAMTPDGSLYTISSTALYSVDSTTGLATLLTTLPGSLNNALTFLPDNTLLAADASGTLKTIDPLLGTVTTIGSYGSGLGSSGDLVAIADGTMYGVSATDVGGADISSNNLLITVDTTTGAATPIGYIGFGNVFGLAFYNGTVYAFDVAGDIISVDPATGAGTWLSNQAHQYFGGTTSPLMPGHPCP